MKDGLKDLSEELSEDNDDDLDEDDDLEKNAFENALKIIKTAGRYVMDKETAKRNPNCRLQIKAGQRTCAR